MSSVSTKLGITRTSPRSLGADLGRDVGPEVVGEHGDRRGAGVGRALQPAGGPDEAGVGQLPELDGDVREHVLDVEDHRAAVDDGRGGRDHPERERGRHGQHGVHAPSGERGHARQGREGGERGRAHRHARLVRREGVDPCDRPPLGRLPAHRPAPPAVLDGVVRVPRQRGDHVQLVAPLGQLDDDARHDLAGRRRVGGEVGAEDDELHGSGGRAGRAAAGRRSGGVPTGRAHHGRP